MKAMREPGPASLRQIVSRIPIPAVRTSNRNLLRIATWNAHCAPRPDRIAEAIMDNPILSEADVILLQEIEALDCDAEDSTSRIARLCGRTSQYFPARLRENGTHGLALLSRIPILSAEPIHLRRSELGFRSRDRIGVAAEALFSGERVRIFNVHLDTRINASTRIEQLHPILERTAGDPSGKTVLAGDFNTMPLRWLRGIVPVWYENQRHAVDAALHSHGFTERIEARGSTMRRLPRFALDSIYAMNASIRASGIERTVRGSDHYPLWADIDLGAESVSRIIDIL